MQNYELMALVALLVLGMSGCANQMTTTTYGPDGVTPTSQTSQPGSVFGPSSYDVGYAGMYHDWRLSQASRATTIQGLACPAEPTAAAYCNTSKLMGMAMMSMETFTVKAPTTGFDVLNHAVDSIVPVTGFVSLYKLGVAGISNAGSAISGNATVTNSLNHTDPSSVNIGAGSSGSSAASTPTSTPTTNNQSFNPVTTTPSGP